MSGPGLINLDSHQMIHDAALLDGEELTALGRAALEVGKREEATQIFTVLCEHWRDSTMLHAQEEETGFYLEFAAIEKWQAVIAELVQEHARLGELFAQMEAGLAQSVPLEKVLAAAEEFLARQRKHNEHEESFLLECFGREGLEIVETGVSG